MADLMRSHEEVRRLLIERTEEGQRILGHPVQSTPDIEYVEDERAIWDRYNQQLLERLFSDKSVAEEYAHRGPTIVSGIPSPQERIQEVHRELELDLRRLRSILNRLELFDGPEPEARDSPSLVVSTDEQLIRALEPLL